MLDDTKKAGVMIFTTIENVKYLWMGVRSDTGQIEPFAGGRLPNEELYCCAARELYEETSGSLYISPNLLQNYSGISVNSTFMYCFETQISPEETMRIHQENFYKYKLRSNTKYMEMSIIFPVPLKPSTLIYSIDDTFTNQELSIKYDHNYILLIPYFIKEYIKNIYGFDLIYYPSKSRFCSELLEIYHRINQKSS